MHSPVYIFRGKEESWAPVSMRNKKKTLCKIMYQPFMENISQWAKAYGEKAT